MSGCSNFYGTVFYGGANWQSLTLQNFEQPGQIDGHPTES